VPRMAILGAEKAMHSKAKSRGIAAFAIAGVVLATWACGAASELAKEKDTAGDAATDEGRPDRFVPEGGYQDGYYESGFEDGYYESGYQDGYYEGGYQDGYYDGGYPDTYYYDSYYDSYYDGGYEDGYYDVYPYDVYEFDVGPIDSGPPWDGGAPVTIATHEEPVVLAVDNTYVYWENSGGTVLTCPVAGCPSNVPTILGFDGEGYGFETLFAANTTAFFIDSSDNIDTCAGGGCGLAPTIYLGGASEDGGFFDAGFFEYYSALINDSVNAYFTDGSSVYSCPLGATCSSPTTLDTVSSTAYIGLLGVSSTEVFYVRQGEFYDSIRAVPISGGPDRVVCTSTPLLGDVEDMVVTDGYVYFTSGDSGNTVSQCPVVGGPASTFATDASPYGLATDGANLYWTNYTYDGTVAVCAVGATCVSPRTVASDQNYPQAVAVNSTSVFWTTTTNIYSAVK
jgi:hypothetical protein